MGVEVTGSISHCLQFYRTVWGEPIVISFKVQCNDMTLKLSFLQFQVRLIASVPGYHSGPSLRKWGHMKLRTVLQECTFSKEFQKSPLIYQVSVSFWVSFSSKDSFTRCFYIMPVLSNIINICVFNCLLQFSSLGSLDEKWMTEFSSSMSAGVTDDRKPLGIGEPMIVWPNVEDVRCSLEVILNKSY